MLSLDGVKLEQKLVPTHDYTKNFHTEFTGKECHATCSRCAFRNLNENARSSLENTIQTDKVSTPYPFRCLQHASSDLRMRAV